MTTRVFLSHSSAHAELARRLARDLGASNIAVTLDQWEGGGGLPSVQSVPRAISDEAFVLPLLTPSEATRSWIGKTWQAAIFDEAVRRDIQVLPVRGEICEEVPEFLRDMSFADLRNRGYELELRRLVETIRERSGDQAITLPAVADDISQSLATDTREPLVIEVGQALAEVRGHDTSLQGFADTIGSIVRDGLFYELGVPFPGLHMRASPSVPAWSARILINGFAEAQIDVPPGSLLVNERVEKLRDLGFVATPATNPANGAPCSWIAADNPTDERLKGLYTWDACEYLVLALSALLRGKAAHFIGVGEARAMLERLASAFPHLVQETVPVPVSDFTFADVLRRLVAEEASIRNLPRILMALADWGRVERDPLFLTEYVRAGLQRQITYRASRGTNSIVVLLLDPEIERSIAEATRHTATGSYVALAPERVRAIVNAIARPVAQIPLDAQWPCLLTQAEVRSSLRRLVAPTMPRLEVVSYDELRADITIQPAGRIGLDRFEAREAYVDGLRVW